MPIFEYACQSCKHEFEALVRGGKTPACPECGSDQLDKKFSLPAVKSDTTRALAMRAAKKRDKSTGKEREAAQREYERNHD